MPLVAIGSDLHVSQCTWSPIPEMSGNTNQPFTLRFERAKQIPSHHLSIGARDGTASSETATSERGLNSSSSR